MVHDLLCEGGQMIRPIVGSSRPPYSDCGRVLSRLCTKLLRPGWLRAKGSRRGGVNGERLWRSERFGTRVIKRCVAVRLLKAAQTRTAKEWCLRASGLGGVDAGRLRRRSLGRGEKCA
jgi:hypothetical protein